MPTILQMVVMLLRKQLVICPSRGDENSLSPSRHESFQTAHGRSCQLVGGCQLSFCSSTSILLLPSQLTLLLFPRPFGYLSQASGRSLNAVPPSSVLRARGCTTLTQQLLGPKGDATTVLRHFVVLGVRDPGAVELGHHLVHLSRPADKRPEGQLVVRTRILDLLDVVRVRPIR